MSFAREASEIRLSIVATLPNDYKIVAEGGQNVLYISIRSSTGELGCLKLYKIIINDKSYWKSIVFKGLGLMLLWDIALELCNKLGDAGIIVDFIPYDRSAYYVEHNDNVYYFDRGEIVYEKENDKDTNFIYCCKKNENVIKRLIQLKLLLVNISD